MSEEKNIKIKKKRTWKKTRNTEKTDPTMFWWKQKKTVIFKTLCVEYLLSWITAVWLKTGPCFKDMKRFSSSVYMFFKKLICSEMKPLYNYSTFKTLGYREYLMRVLFFLWSILWVDAVLLNNLSISWNMFWFCLKKMIFHRRSKRFLGLFCLTGPFYGDFTFAFGDSKIEKQKFHSSKSAMKNLDIYEILIFDEFT